MAATSHDFWLRTLTAPIWKTLHMLVYLAYALVVAHVSLGALQAERSAVLPTVLLAGVAVVAGLHLRAAALERRGDREQGATASAGFVDVCAVSEIPDRRAKTVCLAGERVAVFKYDGRVSAVSNVCRHQNGPLGEGRIVDGCIVCPWHGYEYAPADGCAPAPFTEKLPTFAVKVVDGRVLVDPTPNPAGTFVAPALLTSVLPSGSREPGAGSLP
jgi:nitrite reductase/ring-hydroxylating ferredoxin subunit